MKYKVCSSCHRILLANTNNYHRDKTKKDGFATRCKECRNKQKQEYRNTIAGILSRLNEHSKERFKDNYIHDITIEHFMDMMEYFNCCCAYTGIPLNEANFSFDHVKTCSRSGLHAVWNIVPCVKGFNSSKGNKELSATYFDKDKVYKIYNWQMYALEKWGD